MVDVYITTSAFGPESVLKKGQAFYLPVISDAGGKGVEIRGELFSGKDVSYKELGESIRQTNLDCVYSVPLPLWKDNGELNEEVIRASAVEAAELGAKIFKFSLGGYSSETSDLSRLKKLLTELEIDKKGIMLTVENDQTLHGGSVENLNVFFSGSSFLQIPAGMTFDIGNWNWSKEDSYEAALKLGKYVVYIHCKHAEFKDNKWITLPLSHEMGAEWRKILSVLPQDVPRAIEFPLQGEELKETAEQYVKLLADNVSVY